MKNYGYSYNTGVNCIDIDIPSNAKQFTAEYYIESGLETKIRLIRVKDNLQLYYNEIENSNHEYIQNF